jgi:replicative DNA helicase
MIDSPNDTVGGVTTDLRKPRRYENKAPSPNAAVQPADRLPPHALDAEKAVLGSILLSPNECLGECITRFKGNQAVFYDLRHQVIYETLVEMYDHKEPIDTVTLHQRLKDKQQLDAVGGAVFLATLSETVASSANLAYYQDIVWSKYILRKLIATSTEVIREVYEHEGQVDSLLDEVETRILRLSEERVEERSNKIKDLVYNAIERIEEFHLKQGLVIGLPTGFPDLDRMTTGLHGGEMIVIAARPSMGKTSLAMNIAEYVAVEGKQPVGVFSLEMTAEQLVLRMLCSRARVNMQNMRAGFLSETDFQKLTLTAGQLSSSPIFVDDSPGLSILQLRAKARRMQQQHGVQLFVIDYLQLLHSTASRSKENRQQEIADISSGIKALAKELKVPIIVLSQLNREMEKREGKPRLSDLRESGAIEQDADLVGLLYKADPGNPHRAASPDGEEAGELDLQDAVPINLLIAKQRNGPTGDVNLMFLKGYTRFESAAKVGAEDVPGNG